MLKFALFLAATSAIVSSAVVLAAPGLSPVVEIGQGQLQGLVSENVEGVYSFKNVPFAQPPTGELRFEKPLAPKPWSGLLNATEFGPGCMTIYSPESFPDAWMIPKTMSEDCLQLNIYTPSLSNASKLPVAVFFYGGNYNLGAASVPLYDGSVLAANGPTGMGDLTGQGIIVVTVNYRLNVLGGLYTGSSINGNYQYHDQLQSLKWCKENIAAFGGNPENVIIWGQSAGAASVTSHMVGPQSWPYFNGALSLSNPIGLMFQTPEVAMKLAAEVLKNVSCPNDGSINMVKCLKAVPAIDLVRIALDKPKMIPHLLPSDVAMVLMPWVPVVDGTVIPSQPVRALASGSFNKVPMIISTVANESNEFTRDVYQGDLSALETELLMDLIFANSSLSRAIRHFYFPNGLPKVKDEHLYLDPVVTDWLWWGPWTTVGQMMSAVNPGQVWQVMFTYFFVSWNDWAYSKPLNWYCRKVEPGFPGFKPPVCHADDLAGYFAPLAAIKNAGFPVPPSTQPTKADISLISQMQGMLGGLAWKGNPGKQFPPMQPPGQPARFYNFSIPSTVETNFRVKDVDFWKKNGLIHF